jgi:hypothetical protein
VKQPVYGGAADPSMNSPLLFLGNVTMLNYQHSRLLQSHPAKPGEPSVLQQQPLKTAVLQPANRRFVELKFVGEKLRTAKGCELLQKQLTFATGSFGSVNDRTHEKGVPRRN